MATIANVRNEINKSLASVQVPGPLYAAAGVGDLAVEKLRGAQARLTELRPKVGELSTEARELPARVQGLRGDVRTRVREFPATVVGAANTATGRATGAYGGLTARGKKLVDRINSQQASQDLAKDAGEVVRSTKAAATTADRGAANATAAAERTATTAKKTATTARKATGDAARKTGDAKSTPRYSTSRSGASKSSASKSGTSKSGTKKPTTTPKSTDK